MGFSQTLENKMFEFTLKPHRRCFKHTHARTYLLSWTGTEEEEYVCGSACPFPPPPPSSHPKYSVWASKAVQKGARVGSLAALVVLDEDRR